MGTQCVSIAKMEFVAVYAVDWSHYSGQYEKLADANEWHPTNGWVVGIKVMENDEKIVIAHEQFDPTHEKKNPDVRCVTVVPKTSILERKTLRVNECLYVKHPKSNIMEATG